MALTSLKLGFSGKFLRQHRMVEFLDSLLTKENTTIIHKKGESPAMRVADALSRLPPMTWQKVKDEIMPNLEEAPPAICNSIHSIREGMDAKIDHEVQFTVQCFILAIRF